MSTGTKRSKTQLSKIFQSGGFLSAFLGRLAVTLMKVGVPLTEIFLSPLATMTSASVKYACKSSHESTKKKSL